MMEMDVPHGRDVTQIYEAGAGWIPEDYCFMCKKELVRAPINHMKTQIRAAMNTQQTMAKVSKLTDKYQ